MLSVCFTWRYGCVASGVRRLRRVGFAFILAYTLWMICHFYERQARTGGRDRARLVMALCQQSLRTLDWAGGRWAVFPRVDDIKLVVLHLSIIVRKYK